MIAAQTRSFLIRGFVILVSPSLAVVPVPVDNFAPNSSGILQITEITKRLTRAMGDIPPEINRIAVYQIKTDPRDFSAGMARYIQAQVEEVFRIEGHRTLVNSPELKTIRVISTDTSFRFTNSVPSQEELWKLGDKLRVDAFIEGSCSKSPDNDVILNLKVFKHKTGDVLWSASFVAGPNATKADPWELNWSVSGMLRYFPLRSGILPRDSASALLDTLKDFGMTQYAIEATVTEAVTTGRWLFFSISAGYGLATRSGGPDNVAATFNISTVDVGIELLGVFFQKKNPDLGYWLGTYLKYQEIVPLMDRGRISVMGMGYQSRVSRHFSLSGGLLFLPFNRSLRGLYSNENRFLTLNPIAYDITYLNYTF